MIREYVSAPLIRISASVDAISILYVRVRDMGGFILFFERACMCFAMWGRMIIVVSVMKPMFVGMLGFRVMPVKMSRSFRRLIVWFWPGFCAFVARCSVYRLAVTRSADSMSLFVRYWWHASIENMSESAGSILGLILLMCCFVLIFLGIMVT